MSWPPVRERLFSKLMIQPETGCLLWTGAKRGHGYGSLRINAKHCYTHRVMYEMFVGPIPDGLEIDHLCRVRLCASPAHLEAVSSSANTLRGLLPLLTRARAKPRETA